MLGMSNELAERAIGVFDSGVGGLTVLAELQKALPNESFLYLGDTARVPYGSRSPETIIRYSKRVAGHLVRKKIKTLVIACNTATTYAFEELQRACKPLNIEVFGVIEPGARAALQQTKNNHIAILGTEGTIKGQKYHEILRKLSPDIIIQEKACPMFVPLVEEGWHHTNVAELIAEKYLHEIQNVDTVILGCTHYPLLKTLLQKIRPNMTFIDSAEATARFVRNSLTEKNLLAPSSQPQTSYLVTDNLERFKRVGYYFLNHPPHPLELIDIHDSDELS